MHIYYDKDTDMEVIRAKALAVVGYGSQGRAHALNLRDSGVRNIVIGLKEGSASKQKAEADGFTVMAVAEAVRGADFVTFVVPDEVQPAVFKAHVADNLKEGTTLLFAHGFSVHFNLVEPAKNVDVIMVAPKGPGHTVRGEYEKGGGVPCLFSVHQDVTGNAKALALSYASAIGSGRSGAIETTFREECETDLFGEQAVLCGGLVELIKAGFETLVEAGYAPEMAYFECLHEVKLIVDLIYEGGISTMNYSVSNTAEFGEYASGSRVVTDKTRAEMRRILKNIQTGKFARDWMLECQSGQPHFKAMRRLTSEHQIEKTGEKLRALMPWIRKKALVDKEKN